MLLALAVNQLRAEVAAAAVMTLTSEEMDESYHQEKGRLRLEKRLTKLKRKKQPAKK